VYHAVVVRGDALLAADCETRLDPWVVVVAGPMQLVGSLPKQLMLWTAGCPHTRDVWGIARSSMQDLLRLILPCFGFSYFLLFLDLDLAHTCCMSLVFSIE
jgi:hypothetical protein